MFALDRLKVVMPLEHVTVHDDSVFTTTIKDGQIQKMHYSQAAPALINITIDYENFEAVIEFTGKILGKRYNELIRLTNIKQCIDNINTLGIVEIDRKEISHATVVKCDITIDIKTEHIPQITSYVKNSINNYDAYSAQPKKNGNLVISKNVDTGKCKRRLTIYDKGREMNLARNRQFLQLYYNGENPFIGTCRFEINLYSMEAIRKVLNIEHPSVWNVLLSARIKNPIRDFLDDIMVDGRIERHTPDHNAYYYDLVLDDNDNDLQKVYNRLKPLYSKSTKMSRVIAPIRERLQTRYYVMNLFTRDKILDLVSSETKVSSFDVFGYSSL